MKSAKAVLVFLILVWICGCSPSPPQSSHSSAQPGSALPQLPPPTTPVTPEDKISSCLRDLRSQWRKEVETVEGKQKEIKQVKLAYQAVRFRDNQSADSAECQWCISKVNGIEKYLEPIRTDIERRKKIDAELVKTLDQLRSDQTFDIDPEGVISRAQELITDGEFDRLMAEEPKSIPWNQPDPDKYMSLK